MNDLVISYIRTYVPKLIGVVVGWLAARGLEVDSTELTVAVIGIVEVVWYALARFLEQRFSWAGTLMLGASKQPAYSPPPAPPVVDAPV